MKIVIQKTKEASVHVDGELISEINHGMVLLICLENQDTAETVEKAAAKILALRIFEDENEKMNHDIKQVNGEILSISQFTLSWNGKKGNRPGFDSSMEPGKAQIFFKKFCDLLAKEVPVKKGVFGARMDVHIINDGPVTFSLEF